MGERRSDLDFIACDKFQPTLLDGQLCYSLNKSSFEKGETGTGERNGFFLIIDPGNHIEPTDDATSPNNFEGSDPELLEYKYASIDLQQSIEVTSSGRIYIDISGGTLRQDNRQLIGQSLIVLVRHAQKDRN